VPSLFTLAGHVSNACSDHDRHGILLAFDNLIVIV
jgi:hypothetical protein